MLRFSTFRLAGATVLVGVIGLAWVGPAMAASSTSPTEAPRATGKTPPQCTGGQIRLRATTNHDTYGRGQTVMMTSSITNVSRSSCTIFLGAVAGWSPSFTVTNKKGTVVWDRCWVNDQPGACATVLRSYALRSGQRYRQRATWDQRSGADGHTPAQVHAGPYTFATHYQYMPGTAVTQFTLG